MRRMRPGSSEGVARKKLTGGGRCGRINVDSGLERDDVSAPASQTRKLKDREIKLVFRVNGGARIPILLPVRLKKTVLFSFTTNVFRSWWRKVCSMIRP